MDLKIPQEFRITSTYLEWLLLYLCFLLIFKPQVELNSYLNHNWQEHHSTNDLSFTLYRCLKHKYIRHTLTHPFTFDNFTQLTPYWQSSDRVIKNSWALIHNVYSFFILVFVQHTFIEHLLHAWYCSTMQVLWWPYGPVMYLNIKNYLHDSRLTDRECWDSVFHFRNLKKSFWTFLIYCYWKKNCKSNTVQINRNFVIWSYLITGYISFKTIIWTLILI